MANNVSKNLSNAVPGRARLMIGLMIVVVVVLGSLFYVVLDKKSKTSGPDVPTGAQLKGTGPGAIRNNAPGSISDLNENSTMVKVAQAEEEKRRQNAVKGGGSFIQGINKLNADTLEQKIDKEKEKPEDNARGVDIPDAPKIDQMIVDDAPQYMMPSLGLTEEDNQRYAYIQETMGLVLQNEAVQRGTSIVSSGIDPYEGVVAALSTGSASNDIVVPGPDVPVVNPGHISYAVMRIGINTDEPGPVMADIVAGPLKGARVMGGAKRQNESVIVTFNVMTFKGESYNINSYAVDPNTSRTALADAVDRHILERYGMLIAASLVDGYAQALSNETTTINTDGSVTSSQSALPDARDQLKLAVGNVGQVLTPIMQERFDRAPTVEVFDGRPVGVLFVERFDGKE